MAQPATVAVPKSVSVALSYLGSQAWGSGVATYCEKFVEDVLGCGWQGASALDAWNRNAGPRRLLPGSQGTPRPGLAVYFDAHPENEGYGHTGIVVDDDAFVSVTYNGVAKYPISGWVARLLGFIDYSI